MAHDPTTMTACFSGTGPGGSKQARYDKAVTKAQQQISKIVAKIESFTTAWGGEKVLQTRVLQGIRYRRDPTTASGASVHNQEQDELSPTVATITNIKFLHFSE